MQNNKFGSPLAFIDMLFNMVIAYISLFILAFMIVKPIAEQQKKGVEMKAEYMITMTWPDEAYDDVDLWVMLPDKKKVNFRNKDVQYVTLDRDDRGAIGDNYYIGAERHLIVLNKEVTTIRAIVPGRYVVNAHMFRAIPTWNNTDNPHKPPYPVKVTLTRLNPTVTDVVTREVILTRTGEQKTAFSFTIKENGDVVGLEFEDVPFIQYTVPVGELAGANDRL